MINTKVNYLIVPRCRLVVPFHFTCLNKKMCYEFINVSPLCVFRTGGRIDHAHHDNLGKLALGDTAALDDAGEVNLISDS